MSITIGIGCSSTDPPGGVDTVESGHLHVQDRQLGFRRRGELHGLDPVLRLGAHLEARVLQQLAQVHPDDRLVLGDQDPHTPSLVRRLWCLPSKGRLARSDQPGEDVIGQAPGDDQRIRGCYRAQELVRTIAGRKDVD